MKFLLILLIIMHLGVSLTAQNVGIGVSLPATKLHVSGADNNGVIATLKITSGAQNMLLDGNEIDASDAGGLYLQNNSSADVILTNGGESSVWGKTPGRNLFTQPIPSTLAGNEMAYTYLASKYQPPERYGLCGCCLVDCQPIPRSADLDDW